MKKLYLLALGLLASATASAQAIYGYGFSTYDGTYTPLEGAAELTLPESDLQECTITPAGVVTEAGDVTGFDLGFTVNYNGVECNQFIVNGIGVIQLGKDKVTFEANGRNFFQYRGSMGIGTNPKNGIVKQENTSISYKIEGEEGSKVLTVQYTNLGVMASMWDDDPSATLSYQLKLAQDGTVTMVYDAMTVAEGKTVSFSVGMCGDAGVVNLREGSEGFATSTMSTQTGAAVTLSSLAAGTTCLFSAPQNCVKPTQQPGNFAVTYDVNTFYKTYNVNWSFDACEADTYLVLCNGGEALSEMPADGTTYAAGDQIGNATVVAYGAETAGNYYEQQGGQKLTFYVFAAGAYGLNGPVYNTVEPLTSSQVIPPAPAASLTAKGVSLNSIQVGVTTNEAGNQVMIAYNTELAKLNTGYHALIGTPTGTYAPGDAIEGGGKVLYVGGSADDILLSDQEPGKNVYFAAYTISDDGVYTLLPEYTGSSPWYTVPYTSQWDNDLRFELPTGWTANENTGFRIEMQNRYTQGNAMQLACSVRKPNPTDGVKNWVATPTVSIPARHASVTFTYAGVLSTSRFASEPYNNWPENDVLAVQVSEDGQNWTDVAKYTATDHPAQEEMTTFNTITGDLDAYAGKQIYIRLYWDTFNSASFGSTLVLNDMKIEQGELPTVPTVTVSDVTYNSAKLSWNTEYPNYKVYYGVKGQEKTGKEVAANTLELTELEAVTEYEAYVIGVTAEGEETEASETISFTTAAWPTVEAPTDLAADDSEWASNGVVTLSWTGTEEMLTYEVRYRESTGTSYEYVQNLTETSTVLGQLEGGKTYVWAVRANCTHDRVTVWSAQGRFTLAKIVEVPEVQVADVTENSAKLTWNTEYPAYNVYYGKKGAEPTCVKVEKANELEILDLEAETEYEAYVVAVDTDGQLSEPSATVSFTTLKSGVGALKAGQIKVFALNGQLTLMSGDEMEAVEVYTAGGQQIASLKACGNQVVIPAQGAVILRVKTAQGVKTFKAVL